MSCATRSKRWSDWRPKRAIIAMPRATRDAHIKALLTGSSQTLPVEYGKLQLGRWQAVFFCEYDGPRERSVWVQILESS